jgi:hypothetical protein
MKWLVNALCGCTARLVHFVTISANWHAVTYVEKSSRVALSEGRQQEGQDQGEWMKATMMAKVGSNTLLNIVVMCLVGEHQYK